MSIFSGKTVKLYVSYNQGKKITMINADDKNELAKKMMVIRIIWGALFSSLFVYILVCHFLADQLEPNMLDPDFPMTLFTNILFAVAVVEVIIAYVVRWFMLKTASREQLDISSTVGKYTTIIIVTNAICESVGIYGLILFLLSQDFQLLYTFMFISALTMLHFRPKTVEIEGIYDKNAND